MLVQPLKWKTKLQINLRNQTPLQQAITKIKKVIKHRDFQVMNNKNVVKKHLKWARNILILLKIKHQKFGRLSFIILRDSVQMASDT